MRATATLLVTFGMAIGAIGLAVAAPGGGHELARAEVQAASGAVQIANSRSGQAVLTAGGVRPGESVAGTVTIGNDSDVRGRFAVAVTGVQETAGVHGGLLSTRARLTVLDVTDPQDPETVYEGLAGGLGEVDLGKFDPDEEREYRVEVTLPDGGIPGSGTTGDNRYQGATLSLGLEWRAAAAGAAAPTPTPTPTAAPPAPTPTPTPAAPTVPTPDPTAPVAIADQLGLPAATACVKSGKLTLRLKSPSGTKVVSATVTVNGRVKARVKGAKVRKPVSLKGLGKKSAKVKVTVKASDRRSYTASRTYRPCAKR
jgi:hypothetical protein